jgi:hypothetical protein
MSLTQLSLAEILRQHVTLEVESIDRMYLNGKPSELVSETATKVSGGVVGSDGTHQLCVYRGD